MNSQAIARISFIIILIVAAHTIKPFSVKNVTHHLIHSAESFVYFLPESFQSRFNHVSQLAVAFSNSLFENGQNTWNWAMMPMDDSRAVVADLQPPADSSTVRVAPMAAVRTTIKRRVPARVALKPAEIQNLATVHAKFEETAMIDKAASPPECKTPSFIAESVQANTQAEEVFHSLMPVVLPIISGRSDYPLRIIQPLKLDRFRIRPIPARVDLLSLPKRPDCNRNRSDEESKEIKLIAFIDEVKRKATKEIVKLKKSTDSILKCETEERENSAENESAPPLKERDYEPGQNEPLTLRPQLPHFDNSFREP